MPDFPWYIPVYSGETLRSYFGPFTSVEARDTLIGSYTGPETLGQPFQAMVDPNASLPRATMIIATADGDKTHWSDGSVTD